MYVRGWRKVDPGGCLTTRLARMAGSGFSERPQTIRYRERERKTTSGLHTHTEIRYTHKLNH